VGMTRVGQVGGGRDICLRDNLFDTYLLQRSPPMVCVCVQQMVAENMAFHHGDTRFGDKLYRKASVMFGLTGRGRVGISY